MQYCTQTCGGFNASPFTLVQRSVGLRCGTMFLLYALVKTKSVTLAFDRAIDRGLTFSDLSNF
jgi:hypothetical protein